MKTIIIILLLAMFSWGVVSGFGVSITNRDATITFNHTADLDSVRFIFCYPVGNPYDTTLALPFMGSGLDSTMARGAVTLDSQGNHFIQIEYYEKGAGSISGYNCGSWLNYDDTTTVKTMMSNNMATAAVFDSLVKVAVGDTMELINHADSSVVDILRLIEQSGGGGGLDTLSTVYSDALFQRLFSTELDSADWIHADSAETYGWHIAHAYQNFRFLKDSIMDADSVLATIEGAGVTLAIDGLTLNDSAWSTIRQLLITNVNATIASRSTFDYTANQVTVGANNDKVGYALSTSGLSLDTGWLAIRDTIESYLNATISSRGTSDFDYTANQVIVGTVNDKTGYALTQSFPTNFADLAIAVTTGRMTVGTSYDKTGYALSASQTFDLTGSISGSVGSISGITFPTNFSSFALDANGKVTLVDTSAAGISYTENNPDDYKASDVGIPDSLATYISYMANNQSDFMADVTGLMEKSDSGIIARAVWDNDLIAQVNRVIHAADSVRNFDGSGIEASVPDSLFDLLYDIEAQVGAGSGAYPCSLYVLDYADSSALQGADVAAYNSDESAIMAISGTDNNGFCILNLDDDYYHVRVYKPGAEQRTIPDTVTVTVSGVNDTIYCDVYSLSDPSPATKCTVKGYIKDTEGNAIENVMVSFVLNKTNVLSSDSLIISKYQVSDSTDATGYFEVPLYPNANLYPTDSKYKVSARHPDGGQIIRNEYITVPAQAIWRLWWE